jgi:hypothetical protein
VLGRENPGGESPDVVARKDLDRLLARDWPGIGTRVDEVDRCSSYLHAVLESLFLRFQTREGRQERRVDVDDPSLETGHECRGKDAHEAGKTDEIDSCRFEVPGQTRLVLGARFPDAALLEPRLKAHRTRLLQTCGASAVS